MSTILWVASGAFMTIGVVVAAVASVLFGMALVTWPFTRKTNAPARTYRAIWKAVLDPKGPTVPWQHTYIPIADRILLWFGLLVLGGMLMGAATGLTWLSVHL